MLRSVLRTMRALRRSPAILVAAAACTTATTTDEPTAVRIVTSRATLHPGDSIHLLVSNVGPDVIDFFPCPAWIDRRVAGRWRQVAILDFYTEDACEAISRPVSPGDSRTFSAVLNANLEPSWYRIRFAALRTFGGPLPIASRISNGFEVR